MCIYVLFVYLFLRGQSMTLKISDDPYFFVSIMHPLPISIFEESSSLFVLDFLRYQLELFSEKACFKPSHNSRLNTPL